MSNIKGLRQLLTRFEAIKPNAGLMRNLALSAIREQKILVPRKTGNLGRSIVLGSVSATRAETKATAKYAAFVERGTRAHVIKPRRAKVLAWPATSGDARQSGSVRKSGNLRFARRVNHPGSKPKPFMMPGAKRAVEQAGFRGIVIDAWNDAA